MAIFQWFKPSYSVCRECGAYFKPVIGYEERWGYLCAIHRPAAIERDEKKDRVLHWASLNIDRLSKMMEEEREANASINQQALTNLSMSQLYAQSGLAANLGAANLGNALFKGL